MVDGLGHALNVVVTGVVGCEHKAVKKSVSRNKLQGQFFAKQHLLFVKLSNC